MASELYIKYQDNNPVPIDISFGRGPQQSLPLLTVAHLIQAFFPNDSPNELGKYSLKLPDGTLLDGNILLSTINSAVHGTFIFPLIITSATDGITLDEYLQTIPPLPTYSDNLPGPSSSIPPKVRHPQLVLHWGEFEREVLNFVQNEILPNAARITTPYFDSNALIVEYEVPILQTLVARNMLQIVAKNNDCTIRLTERGSSVGNPDGYIVKEDRISIVYEIKGKWTLNPDLFLNGRIDNIDNSNSQYRFIYNALNQIYTYMVWNHLQYGMLSSFDYTFFLKRVKVENASDGFEQLLISTGISHNSTNPTILQSLAYFMSLADGVPFKSPPPSPLRMSPRTSRASSVHNSPRTSRTLIESQPSADDNDENSPEPHYSLEDFSIKSVLGQGRTKVYYEAKNRIALKAIDLYKQSSMIDELKHEMEVYKSLSDLQGSYIPKLLLHGFYEGGMYFIGFSLCGNVPEKLDTKQKRTLLRAMDLIHSRGIVHNDIKKENILVDGSSNPYIIDFGFATINTTQDAQHQEKAQLQSLLELF